MVKAKIGKMLVGKLVLSYYISSAFLISLTINEESNFRFIKNMFLIFLKSMFWLQGRKIVDWLVLLQLSHIGHVDTSKWKKMDSRRLGILLSMIPEASRIVLKVLQNEGHSCL